MTFQMWLAIIKLKKARWASCTGRRTINTTLKVNSHAQLPTWSAGDNYLKDEQKATHTVFNFNLENCVQCLKLHTNCWMQAIEWASAVVAATAVVCDTEHQKHFDCGTSRGKNTITADKKCRLWLGVGPPPLQPQQQLCATGQHRQTEKEKEKQATPQMMIVITAAIVRNWEDNNNNSSRNERESQSWEVPERWEERARMSKREQ